MEHGPFSSMFYPFELVIVFTSPISIFFYRDKSIVVSFRGAKDKNSNVIVYYNQQ
jgi:hypothetical protein